MTKCPTFTPKCSYCSPNVSVYCGAKQLKKTKLIFSLYCTFGVSSNSRIKILNHFNVVLKSAVTFARSSSPAATRLFILRLSMFSESLCFGHDLSSVGIVFVTVWSGGCVSLVKGSGYYQDVITVLTKLILIGYFFFLSEITL